MACVIPFHHPTTILIAGPTFSGKTTFVKRLIRTRMIQPPPQRIIWIYKEQDDKAELEAMAREFPTIQFHSDLDNSIFDSINPTERNLVILDDVMSEAGDSKSVAKLFTQGSHHRNMTVVFLLQNLFHQAKQMRNISLNTHYMVLYKNPRDQGQIRSLSYQMYPTEKNFLADAFADATATPHSYLLLDLHPETPEHLRVRARIFPGEQTQVFVPREYKNTKE